MKSTLYPALAALVAFLTFSGTVNSPLSAAPLGPAPPGAATAAVNPATGEVFVSANGVYAWQIRRPGLNSSVVTLPPGQAADPAVGPTAVGQTGHGALFYTTVDLGQVLGLGPNMLAQASNSAMPFDYVLGPEIYLLDDLPQPGDPATPGRIRLEVTPTGHVIASVNTVALWALYDLTNDPFTGAPAAFPPPPPGVTVSNADSDFEIGQFLNPLDQLPAPITFTDHNLGPLFTPGSIPSRIAITYHGPNGTGRTLAVPIPEPATVALAGLSLVGAIVVRRRSRLKSGLA